MIKCGPDECPIVAFSDLSPAEQRVQRKRKAEIMTNQGFTQEQIAKQLHVSRETIRDDLREFDLAENAKSKRAKTATNPKGAGRRKGKRGEAKKFAKARELVRPRIEAGQELKTSELEREHGISKDTFERAALAEQARKEALAEPQIAREDLSLTAQQKFDAAIHQHQRKLNLQFEQRVLDEIGKRIDGLILPHWKQQIEQAKELYTRRRALMDKDTFNIIRRALHPDSRQSISDHKLGEAFATFMSLEKYLINEKDSPTTFERNDGSGLPSSLAEWDRMRTRPNTRRAASLRVRR